MVMSSGIRPFTYENQGYPFFVPSNANVSGIFTRDYYPTEFMYAHHIGQAWFAALAELRSLPSGHPNSANFNVKDIYPRAIIYVAPCGINDGGTVAPRIYEPTPSGDLWLMTVSGVPAQVQMDVAKYYFDDLRNMYNKIFQSIACDYPESVANSGTLLADYLKTYFPVNNGEHNHSSPTGFYDVNLAELQFNPYPRIAGDAVYPLHDDETVQWNFYTGRDTGTYVPSNEDFKFMMDLWHYGSTSDPKHDQGSYSLYRDYYSRSYWGSTRARSSLLDDGNWVPFARELFNVFGVVDRSGPVFPACQTLDGRLTTPSGGDPNNYDEPREWWKDGAVLGSISGTYTLGNQSGQSYNRFSELYVYPSSTEMSDMRNFMRFYYWAYRVGASFGGDVPNVAFSEQAWTYLMHELNPPLYGYDPGDYLIGHSAWYGQDISGTVCVHGEGLNPETSRLRIINLSDRTYEGWEDCQDYILHASGNPITQSGSREVHHGLNHRNYNEGVAWHHYPALSHGFPSHSGEPLNFILDEEFDTMMASGYVQSVQDRRAWFPMPNTYDVRGGSGEQLVNLISPIFAERRNVRKVAVINDATYQNGICVSGIASSGQFSIWPSQDEFQNGSGVGYHVMDKGIWMRKHPCSCGMTLISPYNGQRLLFKRAEDRVVKWGEETGEWRREVRPGNDMHFPEYYETHNDDAWNKIYYYRDPNALKTAIAPLVYPVVISRGSLGASLHVSYPPTPIRWIGKHGASIVLDIPYATDHYFYNGVLYYFANGTTPWDLSLVHAEDPSLAEDHDTYLKTFTDTRGYVVSWYRHPQEHALHTDGTYTIFNRAAQPVKNDDRLLSRVDYLEGDNYNFWVHDHLDPTNGDHTNLATWGADKMTYPIATGWWHASTGGAGGFGGPGNDNIAPIVFSVPGIKYSPLLSQCTLQGTFQARAYSSVNDYWREPGVPTGQANLFCDVDIYIAKKPYVQWDIPGLSIQRSGEATVSMDSSMLESILIEGGLSPGFRVVQTQRWKLRRTSPHGWEQNFEQYTLYDPVGDTAMPHYLNGDDLIGTVQHEVAYDGYLALRLDMFALQESSKGGIIEGWGRLVETATAGITEEPDPEKDWPDTEEPTNRQTGQAAYYLEQLVRSSHPIYYLQFEQAYWDTNFWLYNIDVWHGKRYGWNSTPRFVPSQADHLGMGEDYPNLYGSRLFRVRFDPKADPIIISCEDDVYSSKRYGLIVEDKIYRYDITNKSGTRLYDLRSTREGENFLPGINPGYVPDPPSRNMNEDYKSAKKCVMSMTWVEDELVAAVDLYDYKWGGNTFTEGRAFEIATISSAGVFDNVRANMLFYEPGSMFTKPRPLLEDRALPLQTPLWDHSDPYMYEHHMYGNWQEQYEDFTTHEDYGIEPAVIFSYSSELSDMWPKIVYTSIA